MKSQMILVLAVLAVVACGNRAFAGPIAYALSNDGSTLIRFDTANPGSVTTIGDFSGAADLLTGIDFRPADGKLYGYTVYNTYVTINLATAITSLASTASITPSGVIEGVDFNPVADQLRMVNTDQENLRGDVDSGVTTADGALAYATGDAHDGFFPFIVGSAYTNNYAGAANTNLYYIDTGPGVAAESWLATTSDPNSGLLTTVGDLGVKTGGAVGFDIYSPSPGVNQAFAMLREGFGASSLYSIDLSSGAATLIGEVPGQVNYGLAVLPEPATCGLLLVSATTLLVCRRRTKVR